MRYARPRIDVDALHDAAVAACTVSALTSACASGQRCDRLIDLGLGGGDFGLRIGGRDPELRAAIAHFVAAFFRLNPSLFVCEGCNESAPMKLAVRASLKDVRL